MSVFLLWDGTYEDREVVSVHASLESAQAVPHGHAAKWMRYGSRWDCEWQRVQHRATVPIDYVLQSVTIPVIDGKATLPDGRVVESDLPAVVVPIAPPMPAIVESWPTACSRSIEERELV